MIRLLVLLGVLAGWLLACNKPANEPSPLPQPPPVQPPPVQPPPIDTLNGWQRIQTGIQVPYFFDIAFNTPATGFVLAGNFGSYRSTDSGKTWTKEPAIAPGAVTLNFFTDKYGYAVGAYNLSLTTDKAATWRHKGAESSRGSVDVCFVKPDVGYMVRQSGPIYKTTDTGQTWQPVAQFPYNAQSFSVYFLNESVGWYARNDSLCHTTDAGRTWSAQRVGNGSQIYSVFFNNPANGWLTTDSAVYRTVDGGVTWSRMALGSRTFDLQFLNSQTGYVSAVNGVWKTTDGGQTWKHDLPIVLDFFSELLFLDEKTGWLVGSGGNIYRWKK